MRVLLARPRGFCAGVEMAISALDRAVLMHGTPLFAFHEIVHNRFVTERFRRRGVIFVDTVDQAPPGAMLVLSAHGVSPDVRARAGERGLRVVDATCPLVTKVHSEVKRFARADYTIILVGHKGHDETVGIIGEAPDRVVLVESPGDAESIVVRDPSRVAFVTQTTLSIDDAASVISVLRRRFPAIHAPPTSDICYATQNRQEAVRTLAIDADFVLVIGSATSSNSQRLVDVARMSGVRARLVDGPDDLNATWFDGVSTVAVTAGASVPDELLSQVLDVLVARFGACVEEQRGVEELVHFALPVAVRGRCI